MQPQLRTVNEVSLADQAYETIRSAILESVLKPNERFTIEEIAARLGISRTPVREALKALRGDGLVRLLPHRGAMVEQYAHDEIRTRYAVTAMLEGYAAELACQKDAEGLAAKLEANCRSLRLLCKGAAPKSDAEARHFSDLNEEFHTLIREGSGSGTLLRLLASLQQPISYSLRYWKNAESRAESMLTHQRIAKAFRARDPKVARALMQQHLMSAYDRVLRQFMETNEAGISGAQQDPIRPRRRRAGAAASSIRQ
jgi:DNA-binding GntR family transcriptional regulator